MPTNKSHVNILREVLCFFTLPSLQINVSTHPLYVVSSTYLIWASCVPLPSTSISVTSTSSKMRVATGLLGRPLSSKQYEQLKPAMKLCARKKDATGIYMQGLLAKWTIFFASLNTTEIINVSASCIQDINKQQPNSLHPGSSRNSNNNPIIVRHWFQNGIRHWHRVF